MWWVYLVKCKYGWKNYFIKCKNPREHLFQNPAIHFSSFVFFLCFRFFLTNRILLFSYSQFLLALLNLFWKKMMKQCPAKSSFWIFTNYHFSTSYVAYIQCCWELLRMHNTWPLPLNKAEMTKKYIQPVTRTY